MSSQPMKDVGLHVSQYALKLKRQRTLCDKSLSFYTHDDASPPSPVTLYNASDYRANGLEL